LFRALLDDSADHLGGDLAELGVLYGRSAILIGASRGAGEVFTVVDLFEDPAVDVANQGENAKAYVGLTRSAFERSYRDALGELPVVVQGQSHTIADVATHGRHRFVHVDASHLHEHVAGDIEVARRLLKPEGILVLDDIRAEHTPGVAAAAWQAVVTTGLRPFAITPYKLYATFGDGSRWQSVAGDAATAAGFATEVQVVNGRELLRVFLPSVPPHPARQFVPPVLWPTLRSVGRRVGRARAAVRPGL
jgi:SAM-dependent methyltransferase